MSSQIVIIGAGGHGKVVADAILKANSHTILGFIDDSKAIGTVIFKDYKVIGSRKEIQNFINSDTTFVLGLGNIALRKSIVESFSNEVEWATIIHPSACISEEVEMGKGSVVLANCIINCGTKIGDYCIIDAGTIVDHESVIGNFVHLSLGTCVGSNSSIASDSKSELGQIYQPFSEN